MVERSGIRPEGQSVRVLRGTHQFGGETSIHSKEFLTTLPPAWGWSARVAADAGAATEQISGRECGHYLRPVSGQSVTPGPGGRAILGTTSAKFSLVAPTTGPSARLASAGQRVWEKVET